MKKVTLKDLIKPKRIEVEDQTPDSRYGKFVVEPLERGYGLTIGNALRRVLLSSLQGAAITSVKIEGVFHEFSTVPGVKEDVSEIILNLKEVIPSLEERQEVHLRLEGNGPGVVTAAALKGDASIQIINPEQHIATLSEGATLSMEVTVKTGRGYVIAGKNKVEGAPEGTIYIDSIFSPIRKVNHVVTNARVGQSTDYDKLTMEIWTDGTINPRSAIAQASHILADQFSLFMGEGLIFEETEPVIDEPEDKIDENLFIKLEEIELSVRSANCLENADIKYVGELVLKTEADMLRTKNFGRKSLTEIKEILTKMNLRLGMKIDGYPGREELDRMSEKRATSSMVA